MSAVRHFDHRLQLFVNDVLCGEANSVGKIVDFKYRIEFQQRGSPHAHEHEHIEIHFTITSISIRKNIANPASRYRKLPSVLTVRTGRAHGAM